MNLSLPLNYNIELWHNIHDIKNNNIKLSLNDWNIIFPEIEYKKNNNFSNWFI